MKKVFLLLSLLFPLMLSAQTFVTEKEAETSVVILKGQCRFEDLKAQPSFTWIKDTANYKPNNHAMETLREKLPQYEMVVVFGSWCDDSQRELPHLYKVLREAGMPMGKVALYGLDRAKKGRDMEDKIFRVEKVPTIILFKNHQEIGRIVETPKISLENDLAEMVEG